MCRRGDTEKLRLASSPQFNSIALPFHNRALVPDNPTLAHDSFLLESDLVPRVQGTVILRQDQPAEHDDYDLGGGEHAEEVAERAQHKGGGQAAKRSARRVLRRGEGTP